MYETTIFEILYDYSFVFFLVLFLLSFSLLFGIQWVLGWRVCIVTITKDLQKNTKDYINE